MGNKTLLLTATGRVGLIHNLYWSHLTRNVCLFIISRYLTDVRWLGDGTVTVSTTGRDLTSGQISLCTGPTWRCTEVTFRTL